jgi:hypothetical protein
MHHRVICLLVTLTGLILPQASAGTKHSPASRFMSYEGRVMCGYQGWFRAEGDGSGEGWVHYTSKGKFEAENLKVDLWPDVSEYPQTYPTSLRMPDGSVARVFSSWDSSTVDVHFRWMRDYAIDGVFMQRFFRVTRTPASRQKGRVILGHALKSSQAYGRALAVMYDLSGLKAEGEDCATVIQDWKELVDELQITHQGAEQTYLYHRGKPLVAIWGLGFPDRSYNIRSIGIEKLIDFLKNDPVYGGCSVMLGVPNYFRDLNIDTLPDPYLHKIMAQADVIMPWTVQRFTPSLHHEMERYGAQVAADLAWCKAQNLDYAPCVYPGFSWHNLSRGKTGSPPRPLDQIPREQGRFYWNMIRAATGAGSRMLYVAMFDEIDEGTAIFKCANQLPMTPAPAALLSYQEVPADRYLQLTGLAGKMTRGEIPVTTEFSQLDLGSKRKAGDSSTAPP